MRPHPLRAHGLAYVSAPASGPPYAARPTGPRLRRAPWGSGRADAPRSRQHGSAARGLMGSRSALRRAQCHESTGGRVRMRGVGSGRGSAGGEHAREGRVTSGWGRGASLAPAETPPDATGARVHRLDSAGHWALRASGRVWAKRGRSAALQSPSHHPGPHVERAWLCRARAPQGPSTCGLAGGPVGFSSLGGYAAPPSQAGPAEDNEGRLPRQPRSGVPVSTQGHWRSRWRTGRGLRSGTAHAPHPPPSRCLDQRWEEVPAPSART